jgi:hypothetical protein
MLFGALVKSRPVLPKSFSQSAEPNTVTVSSVFAVVADAKGSDGDYGLRIADRGNISGMGDWKFEVTSGLVSGNMIDQEKLTSGLGHCRTPKFTVGSYLIPTFAIENMSSRTAVFAIHLLLVQEPQTTSLDQYADLGTHGEWQHGREELVLISKAGDIPRDKFPDAQQASLVSSGCLKHTWSWAPG